MDFRILGPVEVFSEGKLVRLSGQKQQALLAYLLLHANEAVPADRLLDELWSDPPKGGLAALQTQISRLRKLLGDRIVSTGSAYALRVEPGELDLGRLRTLLAQAATATDPAERSSALRSAESLWRGAPLDGLQASFVAGEAAALEELRLAAIEDRLEADLDLGHDAELVPELSALVRRHPLRERLRAHLILALYRSGRQADALEAYRETRRILDEELGLAPSPALRELERAILRHDPALAPAVRPAIQPGPRSHEDLKASPRSRLKAPLVAAAVLALAVGTGAAIALTRSDDHARAALPPATKPSLRAQHHAAYRSRTNTPPGPASTASVKPTNPATHSAHTTTSTPPRTPRTTPTTTAATTTSEDRTSPRPPTTTAATITSAATKPHTRPQSRPAPKPMTISDTFDGNQIDGTIWYPIRFGTDWTMTEREGHLEFSFPPSSLPGPPYDNFGGHIGTQCKFPADFDARVDFTLVNWPPGNGINVLLYAFLGPTNIGWQSWRRSSAQYGESYGSYTGTAASVSLNDATGSLRLARHNGTITAYFLHNGAWDELTSGQDTSPATIAISAIWGAGYNNGPFSGQQVTVDFDSFTVTGTNPICPRGSQPSP